MFSTHTTMQLRRLSIVCLLSAALAGCASDVPRTTLLDLGPVRTQATTATTLPAISLADVQAPAWLDSQMMFYRLDYANDLQPRAYSASRWSMPPAQLFAQRLKASLSRAGGTVIAASDGAINLPTLRLDIDEFSQRFDSASKNHGEVAVRASLFDGRVLRAQKMFVHKVPSSSADAQGGAAALAAASDAVIADMSTWLATLPPKR
ncbi:MAG: ABC-type transport auxiliary lipoprotein family protein [Oxalicibacterium faecigallinarum]|uniref:ABC-type transport auxiliary lipoprotein family protein n=1 Tax=Oxalicibacterium faecigallinarum TaxID=573741 RepID=UPI0028096765|nr:ABC-type transport auxiliary lipoprotein family protein [Oxalicibacterium faecigallinarum]MDQ7969379.1 ABC-type transport auxiliary lipoprotein family protein [Oxalicibacterium faecigallinarum]